MNIPPIIPIGVLAAIMISGAMYPKRTMIFIAAASLILLLYPLLRLVKYVELCH